MADTPRRRVLRTAGWAGLAGLAGCVDRLSGDGPGTPSPSDTTVAEDSLTDWERSTDCDQTPTGMHDSVIEVKEVLTDLWEGYVPIRFAVLSAEENEILRTVTEDGGYGTCDTPTGLVRFIDRIQEHRDEQDEGADDMRIYLERDGIYYRLYVEKQDVVYAH